MEPVKAPRAPERTAHQPLPLLNRPCRQDVTESPTPAAREHSHHLTSLPAGSCCPLSSTPPQGLPPSLTVWPTQPGMLTALLRPFTPASAEATGTSIVASDSDSNHTPLSSRDRHAKTNNTQSRSRPQLKGAPMRYPFVHWENSILAAATRVRLQRRGSPKASAPSARGQRLGQQHLSGSDISLELR
jgi:hypothetical protein